MKTRIASLLALVATFNAFAVSPVFALSADPIPAGFSVRKVIEPNNVEIARGDTLMTVRRILGAPRRQLSPEVWVYSGYHPEIDTTAVQGCDMLIVTFANDKVVDLKVVNDRAVQVIATNLNATTIPAVQVARR